jgi:hypothetical protein
LHLPRPTVLSSRLTSTHTVVAVRECVSRVMKPRTDSYDCVATHALESLDGADRFTSVAEGEEDVRSNSKFPPLGSVDVFLAPVGKRETSLSATNARGSFV